MTDGAMASAKQRRMSRWFQANEPSFIIASKAEVVHQHWSPNPPDQIERSPPISISMYPFVCLSVDRPIYLSVCLSIYPSIYKHPSIYLSVYLSIYQSIYQSIYLSICDYLSIDRSIPSVCLSLCLFLSVSATLTHTHSLSLSLSLSLTHTGTRSQGHPLAQGPKTHGRTSQASSISRRRVSRRLTTSF